MPKKNSECQTLLTICIDKVATDAVDTYQTFVKKREQKASFNKSQTINRIINEWAEDRLLTLEVAKKK